MVKEPKEIPQAVFDGEALKLWRERMGYSVIQASEAIGCAEQSVRNWEHGDSMPPRYIDLACQALMLGMTSRTRSAE